ncbi:MAG: tyrosine-type recombinase/integrase [Saprospiraceae bacterium]
MAITSVRNQTPSLLPIHYQKMVAEIPNLKYRVIGLMMLDCGIRPGEAARVQVRDLNFGHRKLIVRSLKKRGGEEHFRELRMSERLLDALANYWKTLKHKTPDSYIFPADTETGYSESKQISKWFKRNGLPFTPKACRHTFASKVVSKTKDIRKAQKLLGHKSQRTTEIYLHIPQLEMDAALDLVQQENWWQQLKRKIIKPKRVFWTPVDNGVTRFHIGRKAELAKLAELMDKQVNVLLLGEHGIGKTHLLQNIPDEKGRFLRMDDFNSTRKRLQELLLDLYKGDPD